MGGVSGWGGGFYCDSVQQSVRSSGVIVCRAGEGSHEEERCRGQQVLGASAGCCSSRSISSNISCSSMNAKCKTPHFLHSYCRSSTISLLTCPDIRVFPIQEMQGGIFMRL